MHQQSDHKGLTDRGENPTSSTPSAPRVLVGRAVRMGLSVPSLLAEDFATLSTTTIRPTELHNLAETVNEQLNKLLGSLELLILILRAQVEDSGSSAIQPPADSSPVSLAEGYSFEIGSAGRLAQALAPFTQDDTVQEQVKKKGKGALLNRKAKKALISVLEAARNDIDATRLQWEAERAKSQPSVTNYANIARRALRPRSIGVDRFDRPPLVFLANELPRIVKEKGGSHISSLAQTAEAILGEFRELERVSGRNQPVCVGSLNPNITAKYTSRSELAQQVAQAQAELNRPVRDIPQIRDEIQTLQSSPELWHALTLELQNFSGVEDPKDLSLDQFSSLLRRMHQKAKKHWRSALKEIARELNLPTRSETKVDGATLDEIIRRLRAKASTQPLLAYFLSVFPKESNLQEAIRRDLLEVIIPDLRSEEERKQQAEQEKTVSGQKDDREAKRQEAGRYRYDRIKRHKVIRAKGEIARYRGAQLQAIHSAHLQATALSHHACLLLSTGKGGVSRAFLLMAPIARDRRSSAPRERGNTSTLEETLAQARALSGEEGEEVEVVRIRALTLRGLKKLIERNRTHPRLKNVSFASKADAARSFRLALELMRKNEPVFAGILTPDQAQAVLRDWQSAQGTNEFDPDALHAALARYAYTLEVNRMRISRQKLSRYIAQTNKALAPANTDSYREDDALAARERMLVFGELFFTSHKKGWRRQPRYVALWEDLLRAIKAGRTTPLRLDAEVKVFYTPPASDIFHPGEIVDATGAIKQRDRYHAPHWNALFTFAEFPEGTDLRRNFPFDPEDEKRVAEFAKTTRQIIQQVSRERQTPCWRYGIDRGEGELASLVIADFARREERLPAFARSDVWVFDHLACARAGHTRNGVPASMLNPADFIRSLGEGESGWAVAQREGYVRRLPEFPLLLDLSSAKVVQGKLTLNGGIADFYALLWYASGKAKNTTPFALSLDAIKSASSSDVMTPQELHNTREIALQFVEKLQQHNEKDNEETIALLHKDSGSSFSLLRFPLPPLAPFADLSDPQTRAALFAIVKSWAQQYTNRAFLQWEAYARAHNSLPLSLIANEHAPAIADRINNIQKSLAANMAGVVRHLYFPERLTGFVTMEFLDITHRTDHGRSYLNTTREFEWALLRLFQKPNTAGEGEEAGDMLTTTPLAPPHLRRSVVERLMEKAGREGKRCVSLGALEFAHAARSSVLCPLCLADRGAKMNACSSCGRFNPKNLDPQYDILRPMWQRVAQAAQEEKAGANQASPDLVAGLVLANPEFCAVPLGDVGDSPGNQKGGTRSKSSN